MLRKHFPRPGRSWPAALRSAVYGGRSPSQRAAGSEPTHSSAERTLTSPLRVTLPFWEASRTKRATTLRATPADRHSAMFSNNQKGLVRGLIYGIQFDPDPIDGVDRILRLVVDRQAMGATRGDFAAAVDAALSSDEPLAQLIPQYHPESVIRAFLTEMQRRLADPPQTV